MIDPTLLASVSDSVRTIARIPSEVVIEPDSRLVEDLGVDSLDLVSIVLSTQERFGVAVDEDDVATLRTVSDLVSYVERRLSPAAA